MSTAFPLSPLALRVDLYIDDEWVEFAQESAADELGAEYRLPRQRIKVSVGRQDERSQIAPSSARVRLWNGDGKLTPADPRSAWWPWIDIGCPMRIRVGSTVMIWGEIAEIAPVFPVGDVSNVTEEELFNLPSVPKSRLGLAMVDITCAGILRRLQQREKPLRSCLYRLITSTTNLSHVFDYFPMEDGTDASRFASGIPGENRAPMTFTGDVKPGTYSGLSGSEPIATVAERRSGHWFATVEGFTDEGVVEAFLANSKAPTTTTSLFRPIDVYASGTLARWSVEVQLVDNVPTLQLRVFDSAGAEADLSQFTLGSTAEVFFTDAPIQMRLELEQDGGSVDWSVNWYTVTRGVDSGEALSGSFTGTLGTVVGVGGGVGDAPPDGIAIGQIIVHDGIAGGWLAGGNVDLGRWGEASRTRFFRLCAEEGIPAAASSATDTESMAVGIQRPLPLPDLLQECAEADNAIIHERRTAFGLRYMHGGDRYNRSPSLTLDASQSQIANPLSPTRDDREIRNDVTGTRLNGTSVRLMDEDSIAKHDVFDEGFTVNLASDLKVRHATGWRLNLGTFDGLRFSELTVNVGSAPSLVADILSLYPGEIIRVENLPPQIAPGPIDLVAQGWVHDIDPNDWIAKFNCTPADPWTIGEWEVSRWSPAESYLTSSIDADDTSISVTTPGILWTTDSGELPIDVMFGPERVTVTAISGASSPQTFTVTRNVNNLGRAHDAGTDVELAPDYACVLGL